ncbi:MAG: Fur family transcriptional regulator [Candidatus Promineifilaceae bacterium]
MSDQFEALCAALADNGHRLTVARQAIARALVACEGHISADELSEQVRAFAPHVGRMTVYRTLELLAGLGKIRPVYQGTGAAHYILLERGHHHHLVCSGCHKVIEFEACLLPPFEGQVAGQHDFEVHGHLVEIFGRCSDCA